MDSVISLIRDVGFPIAFCVLVYYTSEKRNETVFKLINDTLTEFTVAINKLSTLIENFVNGGNDNE